VRAASRGQWSYSIPATEPFALAVIEAWAAQVGEDALPPGIRELRDALREDEA
jgi:hypothetical protein